MFIRFPRFEAGKILALTGNLYNAMVDAIERSLRLTFSPEFTVTDGPYGQVISLSNAPYPVTIKITAVTATGIYSGKRLRGRVLSVASGTALSLPQYGETVAASNDCVVENTAETAGTTSIPLTIGSFVTAIYSGMSNDATPLPVYRTTASSSGDSVIKITSNASGAGAYNGTIYQPPATYTSGDLAMPVGLTAGSACLLLNTEEDSALGTAAGTHRLFVGSYVIAAYAGSPGGTAVFIVRGGVGTVVSPKSLPAGTYNAPDATTWGFYADGKPSQVASVLSAWGFDATSGNIWWHTRAWTFDSRGVLKSISGESETILATGACASSTSSAAYPAIMLGGMA